MGSSDPTLTEKTYFQAEVVQFSTVRMIWPAVATLSLALSVSAQEYTENRRRGSFDEDTLGGDYIYADYDAGNGLLEREPISLPVEPQPPRNRLPPRRPERPEPNPYEQSFRRPSSSFLQGRDACQSGAKSVAHEDACDLYYECYEGQGFLTSCPNGLVYGGEGRFGLIGNCDYPHNVNCQGREKRNPPEGTEHCDWLYGIFGHETSCTRYWTCWNGTATEQFCIGGLLYNEETHACDWPQNVAGCQKHPLCKDDANGNVPLGKSCNRYWACQGGYPRLQRCPAMLVFDKNRRRCVTPPTEDCEVPTTKAPPPGEEDNFASGPGDDQPQQSPNPRRGGGGRRPQGPPPGARPLPSGDGREPLPFDLPPGAVPFNSNN